MNFTIAVEPRCRKCSHIRCTHIADGPCNAVSVISTPGSAVAAQGSCNCRRYVPPRELEDANE
jgi:hypothetical protein